MKPTCAGKDQLRARPGPSSSSHHHRRGGSLEHGFSLDSGAFVICLKVAVVFFGGFFLRHRVPIRAMIRALSRFRRGSGLRAEGLGLWV